MIPLKDDNPRVLTPFFNIGLILCNVAVFIYQFSRPDPDLFVHAYGAIPVEIMSGQNWSSLITAMFLHGGWLHLLGNMLYLWIFGDNVEGLMGHGRYLIFYLLCGLAATISQIVMMPLYEGPLIGAISGVLGAYLVKFPRAYILQFKTLPIVSVPVVQKSPALVVLGFWFVMQLTSGFGVFHSDIGNNVAWFANIGGFLTGVLFVKFFERLRSIDIFRQHEFEEGSDGGRG